MMFGYADDRPWWRAGPVPSGMTAFWGLPIRASYSVITGVTRPGPWARDRKHRCDDARRILDGRLAHGEIGAGAYRQLREELSHGAAVQAAASPTTAVAVGTVTG